MLVASPRSVPCTLHAGICPQHLSLSFTFSLFSPEPKKETSDPAGDLEPASSDQRDCQPPGF